jgi:hypothetical protein
MDSEFEEGEFRAPFFNQLEKGSHLLWEPGQVFEKKIGIDRASQCISDYLWNLHGYSSPLNGAILRGRRFHYIWSNIKPNKQLPDFSLNLFIQAKRPKYSSQSNKDLNPNITSDYWYFDITPHQQTALENLDKELKSDALVIYASPVFHRQQDLYNRTVDQSIVENTSFPKASQLMGHSRWYYNKPGMTGIANPDFEFLEGNSLLSVIELLRTQKGEFSGNIHFENLLSLASSIRRVVESSSQDFRSSRFASLREEIDFFIEFWDLSENKTLKAYLEIETFNYLWKLQWLTF